MGPLHTAWTIENTEQLSAAALLFDTMKNTNTINLNRMKNKFTLLMLVMSALFAANKAQAWNTVKFVGSEYKGETWGSNQRVFTKQDDNTFYLELNCSADNVRNDFYFRIDFDGQRAGTWDNANFTFAGTGYENNYGMKSGNDNGCLVVPQSTWMAGKITIWANFNNEDGDWKWHVWCTTYGWMSTEETISTYDASTDDYYFVSPELTGGNCLEYFRLHPSRPRTAGSAYSGRFFTFHLQDFAMGTNSSIHYWIQQKSTGKKFYAWEDNYELGKADNNDNQQGKGVIYQDYGTQTTEAHSFLHTKHYSNAQSLTIFFDDAFNGGEGQVSALLNSSYCGTGSDAGAYYLIGNFSNTDHLLDPSSTADRKLMTKYYYKDGLQYTSEQTPTDSIVYRVTVTQPAGGWSSLYMLVFDKNTIDNWANDYSGAIRPQTQWNYTLGQPSPFDSDNHPYYEGLDATATRGGLYTRRDGAASTDQAFNPEMTDDILSYTFSMNVTTSTYTITFNKKLFIMGPAVNGNASWAEDGADADAAWSSAYPDAQTDHAYELVFDPSDKSYSYRGNGGTLASTEQKIHLVNGQRLAFVWDKNFADAFYAEDDVYPLDFSTKATELANYGIADNDKGNFDTQYVNYLSIYKLEKATFQPSVDFDASANQYSVDGAKFLLPTGDYYIRLYITEINEQQYVYYVIRDRAFTFQAAPNAKTSGTELDGKYLRTFCDYHAVVLANGVTPYFVSSYYASPAQGEGAVTLVQYPLNTGRVLPANTPVILVSTQSASNLISYYGANPKATGYAISEYNKPAIAAGTDISAHEGTTYDNFVLGYKMLPGDTQNSVGFFHPETGYKANANTSYLQLPYNYLGDAGTSPHFVIKFEGDLTGIDCINDATTTTNDPAKATWYDLSGRRVQTSNGGQLQKGIYVVNGKKVIIK